MVKKIHIVRKSRRRSRRRSPRKSKKNKKSNRRSRRKSNTKKLKGGSESMDGDDTDDDDGSGGLQQSVFARPSHTPKPPPGLAPAAAVNVEEWILKEYLIPHVGGKPKVLQEKSFNMTPKQQKDILKLLQKDTQMSTSADDDRFVIVNPMNKG